MNIPKRTFKELSDSDYTGLRGALLKDKGSGKQRTFLEIVRDREKFLQYFEEIPTVGNDDAVLSPGRMTESEFRDPPTDTEQALYASWEALTPSVACRSTFWARLTLDHIKGERIHSAFLAANGGGHSGGAERIDFALGDASEGGSRQVDLCVRTVLRRMGGLPEVRGNRSVYVDCPFARAWWRERIVAQVAGGNSTLAGQVRHVVRIHQTYWEKLIDRIVTRNSTFGSNNIRNAFIRALAKFIELNPDTELKNTRGLQRLCRRTTTYQGNRELSVLNDAELDDIMSIVIDS